jgi:hypothetical protein
MRKTGLLLASVATAMLIAGFTLTVSDPQQTSYAQAADPARPNILFILTDDMKARELQYMPNTQSLLADQGVKFTEAYVTRSLCCPSRASTLRGQYAHNHEVWVNVPPLGGFWKFYDQGLETSTIATWLDDPDNFDDGVDYDTVLCASTATMIPPPTCRRAGMSGMPGRGTTTAMTPTTSTNGSHRMASRKAT